jgi:phosphate transport system substrate-binding protein
MRKSLFVVLSALVALSMLLAACSTPATAPTTAPAKVEPTKAAEPTKIAEPTKAPEPSKAAEPTKAPEPTKASDIELPLVDPSKITGAIYAAGSSTVYPLAEAIVGEFKKDGYTSEIKIDSIGSGAGFERFCKTGETDIATASRKIKDTELENCKKINRTPVAFNVGTDAIVLVTNKGNDFLKDVKVVELAKIFSSEAEKWSDVNPAWPKEPILRYVPGTDSGTFDYFVTEVMDKTYVKDAAKDKGKGKEMFLKAKNLNQSEDDNVLVQGVEGNKYAIAFFGAAYFAENKDKLNAISLEGVAPSLETAENGSYKLSRPLFLYSDAKIMEDKPQVAAFINYFISNVNDLIAEVGYFPASTETLNTTKQAFLDASK